MKKITIGQLDALLSDERIQEKICGEARDQELFTRYCNLRAAVSRTCKTLEHQDFNPKEPLHEAALLLWEEFVVALEGHGIKPAYHELASGTPPDCENPVVENLDDSSFPPPPPHEAPVAL